MKGQIFHIDAQKAIEFILPRHYAGRKPQVTKAFAWYVDEEIVAVCTFGKPASNNLCYGICGREFSENVYELNRLCRVDTLKEPLSQFVGGCLRRLRTEDWIIVSYADLGMHHNGYIYQACNFIYTGTTKQRTDKFTEGNKHSRHYSDEEHEGDRKIRTPKRRYVYFCSFDKKLKKKWLSNLKYPILPYPKSENKNYQLGGFPLYRDNKNQLEFCDL